MKALETLLVVGVIAVGGYVAIRMLQGRPFLSNIGGGLNPFQFTRQQYIASPTTPGALQPNTANKSTPQTRAQSTGGGVGGPGYVVPGSPKPGTIFGDVCSARCAPLKNSAPQTYQECCRASRHARRRRTLIGQVRDYPRYAYNAVKDSIRVI